MPKALEECLEPWKHLLNVSHLHNYYSTNSSPKHTI